MPYITKQIPDWLDVAVSRRLVTRKVAVELCDWAYQEGVTYHGFVDERVYNRAVAGETTEAIAEFRDILRAITRRAEQHREVTWGEPQNVIWRKQLGSTLLLDIRTEIIQRVSEFLPEMIAYGDSPDDDKRLFLQVLDTYK